MKKNKLLKNSLLIASLCAIVPAELISFVSPSRNLVPHKKDHKDEGEDDLVFERNGDGYEVKGFSATAKDKTTVTIPDTHEGLPVTIIGLEAFAYQNKIQTVTIGKNVTEICGNAFYRNSNLKRLTFADDSQLQNIGQSAFENCIRLSEDVTLPSTTTTIGKRAFAKCTSLRRISLANDEKINGSHPLSSIGQQAFIDCTKLQEVNYFFDSSITEISDSCFKNCNSLQSFYPSELPETVTKIGNSAFSNCYELGKINISTAPLESIGTYAFYNCSNFEIDQRYKPLPETLTSIGQGAFCNCARLGTVNIPSGVTSIEPSTFESCNYLTNYPLHVYGLDKEDCQITSIGVNAFKNTKVESDSPDESNVSFYIPQTVTSIGLSAFEGSEIGSFNIPAGCTVQPYAFNNAKYTAIDFSRFNASETETYLKENAFANPQTTKGFIVGFDHDSANIICEYLKDHNESFRTFWREQEEDRTWNLYPGDSSFVEAIDFNNKLYLGGRNNEGCEGNQINTVINFTASEGVDINNLTAELFYYEWSEDEKQYIESKGLDNDNDPAQIEINQGQEQNFSVKITLDNVSLNQHTENKNELCLRIADQNSGQSQTIPLIKAKMYSSDFNPISKTYDADKFYNDRTYSIYTNEMGDFENVVVTAYTYLPSLIDPEEMQNNLTISMKQKDENDEYVDDEIFEVKSFNIVDAEATTLIGEGIKTSKDPHMYNIRIVVGLKDGVSVEPGTTYSSRYFQFDFDNDEHTIKHPIHTLINSDDSPVQFAISSDSASYYYAVLSRGSSDYEYANDARIHFHVNDLTADEIEIRLPNLYRAVQIEGPFGNFPGQTAGFDKTKTYKLEFTPNPNFSYSDKYEIISSEETYTPNDDGSITPIVRIRLLDKSEANWQDIFGDHNEFMVTVKDSDDQTIVEGEFWNKITADNFIDK